MCQKSCEKIPTSGGTCLIISSTNGQIHAFRGVWPTESTYQAAPRQLPGWQITLSHRDNDMRAPSAVEFMLWQPVQLTYLWNVELVKMLSGRHSYEYECPGTRKPLCSITCEEVWLETGMSRYIIFHATIWNFNLADFISLTNKVRHQTKQK